MTAADAGPSVALLAAAGRDALPVWAWAALPLLLAALWVAVTTLLALLGGHMRLVARFPPAEDEAEETFSFASGRLGWVSYNNVLHVRLGARGLHLAANGLFRTPFRRGIPCIPWREVRLVRSQAEGWVARFRGSKFEVAAAGVGFTLYGRAGVAVERRLAALGLSSPAHARAFARER